MLQSFRKDSVAGTAPREPRLRGVHARLRLALLTLTACLAAATIALALAQRGPDGEAGATPAGLRGAIRPPGLTAGELRLRDERGRPASFAAYRGRPLVVTFVYSTCRDTCPIMVQQIRQALDSLGSRAVPALAISVDPVNDTPARARAFLQRQRVEGRMRFLLGSSAQLAPVWRQFAIAPQRDGAEHSAYVVLVDGRGRQRVGFPQGQLTPEGLVHDVRRLQAEPR